MNGISFGKSRPNQGLTYDDVVRHPIWIWAVDEENAPGQDETWVKPITSHADVTEELFACVPRIALTVPGTDWTALGDFWAARDVVGDHILRNIDPDAPPTDIVSAIQMHDKGGIVSAKVIRELVFPVTFLAIPTIRGKAGLQFGWNRPEDPIARRIDGGAADGS